MWTEKCSLLQYVWARQPQAASTNIPGGDASRELLVRSTCPRPDA